MEQVRLRIEAQIYPTEDEEKVSKAVKKLAGEVNLKTLSLGRGLTIRAEGEGIESLSFLKRKLQLEQIRDAARALLLRSIEDKRILFHLNKQAAYAGHVSFSPAGQSPLGPITVEIECGDPKAVVEWLTRKESGEDRRSIKDKSSR